MASSNPVKSQHILYAIGVWAVIVLLAISLMILGLKGLIIFGGLFVGGLLSAFAFVHVLRFLDGGDHKYGARFSVSRMIERYPVPLVCTGLLDRSKLWNEHENVLMEPDHMFVFLPSIFIMFVFVALDGLLLPITLIIFAFRYRDARRREVARTMHHVIKKSNEPSTLQVCTTATGRWSSTAPNRANAPRCANWSPATP
jgi:hypothetical protein